jgi:hypothetical protein
MLTHALVSAALALGLAQAETLDRIAVTVGQDVITESRVILDLRVAAFLEHSPLDLSGPAKRKAAERMVDQLLILREAADSHVTLPSTEAAAGLVAPYAAESGYQTDLARYGISERDLAAHLLAGLRTLTFTDLRFRPDIVVSADDIRSYYDTLARQPGSNRAPLQSFEESRDQIERLLVEQRVLDALDKWLETARSAARVQYRERAFQ